ncbi:hypothetical protein [Paracoccus siganidrum]|uniref:Uncharacterized protein n=1 Tax=Paracoccus siganidrum TaxID=1276757 RepID=A0A419AAG6_9RHOB|nr:hypothetical protein [Paracoccus siganidrum]RJL19930.1 hypothetical protein D3P05_04210 [Paracoccus siganidrum]RMC35113.1 hypothetical protein C9E82_10900 [Paracoccus siganidrum]
MLPVPRSAQIGGFLIAATMVATVPVEYGAGPVMGALSGGLAVAAMLLFALGAPMSRKAFVLIGLGLVLAAALLRADWLAGTMRAIGSGSFIVALFTALAAIRYVAAGSPQMIECGRFLARQPPGLRYLALTVGGHLFGLILLYGSISLLGTLAAESAAREPDAEIRRHRLRRMLVAIQRGFAATLCWSPLAFSMAISTTLVEGASWRGVVLPCLASAALMLLAGWGMDTAFKPKLARSPAPRPVETGRWLTHLRPLLILLAVVIASVSALHLLTGVEIVGAVMTVVPLTALAWLGLFPPPGKGRLRTRLGLFASRELAGYGGEIVLLFMAAFIGSMGAFLLVPVMAEHGPDLTRIPPALLLAALVWLIPLTGQFGMNPILSVTLLVPLLPTPEALGVSPAAMVVAITGGWALSGNTSPFTASVLIVGRLGGIAARDVGLFWNGAYLMVSGALLTGWVLAVTALI